MKKLLAAVLVLASIGYAFAQSTKLSLDSEINTNWPDNTTGAITPAILRSTVQDVVASYVDWLTCTVRGGTLYWGASAAPSCLAAGTSGQFLKTQGAGADPVWATPSLPASGLTLTSNQVVVGNNQGINKAAQELTITSILDFLGTTRGSIIERGASVWAPITPGTTAFPFVSNGAGSDPSYQLLPLAGGGCNAALTASNGGILYSTASACAILAGTATAGQILRSGATAAPTWSTTTYPATSPAGTVLGSTSANILTPTSTPILGASGTLGSVELGNATTGTVKIQPVTGALGSSVMSIPALTKTLTATIASGAKTLNTTVVPSASCTTAQTDTATGTLTTDVIVPNFNGDPTAITGYVPSTSGMLTIFIYPSADTANFKVCNNTSNAITPSSVTLNWRVVR